MIKRTRTLDFVIPMLAALLVASVLAPAMARLQRTPADAKCQSNLRQWARAMALYCDDNQGTYPTNRTTNSTLVSASVQLSGDLTNTDGSPVRFKYGVNWVEALYPYLQENAAKTGQDWKSFRECPNVTAPGQPMPTACMSYAFNYNLTEYRSSLVRDAGSVMMLREMDRLVNSLLRPVNRSTDASNSPLTAFMARGDSSVNPSATNPDRHGTGSYVAFADGHVRYFTTEYYPASCRWDAATSKWYNFVYANPSNDTERRLNKSIAVTP